MKKVILFIVITGGIIAGFAYAPGLWTSKIDMCAKSLKTLNLAFVEYRNAHNGCPPISIEEIDKEWDGAIMPLMMCPGGRNQSEGAPARDKGIDYIYVNWVQKEGVVSNNIPGEYPMVYDRCKSNHAGKGVNVLLANGRVIWDNNAQWLTSFASNHSLINLPK